LRLKNEVRGIHAEGGRVYRIKRNSGENNTTTGIPQHNSEVEQREIVDEELDGVINNNGTLDELNTYLTEITQKV
jgi:hypothetical protein